MAKSLKNLSEGLHFEMKLQEGEVYNFTRKSHVVLKYVVNILRKKYEMTADDRRTTSENFVIRSTWSHLTNPTTAWNIVIW